MLACVGLLSRLARALFSVAQKAINANEELKTRRETKPMKRCGVNKKKQKKSLSTKKKMSMVILVSKTYFPFYRNYLL